MIALQPYLRTSGRRCQRVAICLMLATCDAADRNESTPSVTDVDVALPAVAARIAFADTLHGVVIADSLCWMEDTTRTDLRSWLSAESTYTSLVLSRLRGRDSLAARIGRIMSTAPTLDRVRDTPARLFLTRWLAASPSLLAVEHGVGTERMLLSDSTLARLRNGATLRGLSPSWDGRYIAIGTTERGDLNAGISLVDAVSGTVLDDRIADLLTTTSGTRYEVTWLPDNSGFIYPRRWSGSGRVDATDALARGRQFLHRLGTRQSADVPVFGYNVSSSVLLEKDDLPTRVLTAPGSPWLMGSVFRARQNGTEWFVAPIAVDGIRSWTSIATIDDAMSAPQLVGDTLYALTRRNADRGSIVRRLLSRDARADANWTTVVAERRGVITNYSVQSDGVYFTERDSGAVALCHLPLRGTTPQAVALPTPGTVTLQRRAHTEAGAVLSLETWASSPRWYRVLQGRAAPLGIDDGFGSEQTSTLVSERLEAPSTDGARVPVSLVYDRVAMGPRDGHAPLLVEAYGAYGKATDATFSPLVQAWIRQGGVYAYAHARGGGEKGDAWHRAAMKQYKQRTIDDVIASIETLIRERYTAAGRVVVTGTSSGAIVPGLLAVQRPDLVGAALFEVGQPDEVRGAQLDPTAARNIAELGDMDTAEGIRQLLRASPYHAVPGSIRLPAMLIHSASGDYNFGGEMLVAKYVARLRAANSGTRPVIWVRTGRGHGELFYASPVWGASVLSFALWQAGDARYQPEPLGRR
jgi:prolyl oligopeptidase